MKFQAIKGVRDILPPDSALWNRVEQAAREVFATYGYGEIRLPIFEPAELFARSVGMETDIVNKEMYLAVEPSLAAHERDRTDLLKENVEQVSDAESAFRQRVELHIAFTKAGVSGGAIPLEVNKTILKQLADLEQNGKAFARTNWIEYVHCAKDLLSKLSYLPQLALRPEATASVVRAYIEHGMHTRPGNMKLYYMGPMFRGERPQKGRYRQFYQIGVELLGPSDHAGFDAEVIEMLLAFFERVHLQNATLYLNSIGCKECRPKYIAELKSALETVREKLGPDSQRRIETNPLRVLDSKLPEEQSVIAGLPRIADYLCIPCKSHYAQLKQELALRGIQYEENWRLVRGLDYYMRTTFEVTAPGLGSQDAVCGGGRYDGLVEMLGGPPTKGIGFAIGTDRLMLSLEQGAETKTAAAVAVYIAWMGAAAYPAAVGLARKLRRQGIAVEMPAVEMKFGKSLSLADRLGSRYAVILGEDELASKQFTVKRLADGEQQKLSEADLIIYLQGAKSR